MTIAHRRFWLWIAAAFSAGVVCGFLACIVLAIILQALISYPQ